MTTAGAVGLDALEECLGEPPAWDQGVLALTSDPKYDCDRLLDFDDLDLSIPFSTQFVYLFPGPIAAGTHHVPDDVRAWGATWHGDGMGNGQGGAGDQIAGEVAIVSVEPDCVTGTKSFCSSVDFGFAVSTEANCMD